jgi:hypothetical protein
MTPWELYRAVEERGNLEARLSEAIVTAGWLAAALERQKRIPPLKEFIPKRVSSVKRNLRDEWEQLKREFENG